MSIPVVDKKTYLEQRLQFQNLSKDASVILKDYGIELNFEGFVETLIMYIKSNSSDVEQMETLIRDLNCWVNYLGEIKSIVHYYKLEFTLKSESAKDDSIKLEFKNKAYILKMYESALNKYKKRFYQSYRDCMEQYQDTYSRYMRSDM